MDRRKFLSGAAVAGAASATLAAPAVAQAKKDMVIVSTWPRDFPGIGLPAQRLAAVGRKLRYTTFIITLFSGHGQASKRKHLLGLLD